MQFLVWPENWKLQEFLAEMAISEACWGLWTQLELCGAQKALQTWLGLEGGRAKSLGLTTHGLFLFTKVPGMEPSQKKGPTYILVSLYF